jgi:hypothetical protein
VRREMHLNPLPKLFFWGSKTTTAASSMSSTWLHPIRRAAFWQAPELPLPPLCLSGSQVRLQIRQINSRDKVTLRVLHGSEVGVPP